MKKIIGVAGLALMLPALAYATTNHYTFNDVVIGTEVVEIQAVVKDTPKNDFTRCDYYSDNYIEWLGYYSEPVATEGALVESFCVAHFDDRGV